MNSVSRVFLVSCACILLANCAAEADKTKPTYVSPLDSRLFRAPSDCCLQMVCGRAGPRRPSVEEMGSRPASLRGADVRPRTMRPARIASPHSGNTLPKRSFSLRSEPVLGDNRRRVEIDLPRRNR